MSTEHNEQEVEPSTEKVEVEQPKAIQPQDRNRTESPTTDEREYDPTNEESTIILPSVAYNRLLEAIEGFNKYTKEDFDKRVSAKLKKAIGIHFNAVDVSVMDDVLVSDEEKVNVPVYADKELITKDLNFGNKGNKITGSGVLATFAKAAGIGTLVQVPLWHSGFWITLNPVTDTEIVNLEMELANSHIELGRDTNTLIYSNYAVVYNRILTEFIVSHIKDTSIELPQGADIRSFIKLQDFFPAVNGVLSSMYPSGFKFVRPCSNTLPDTDKPDAIPKCDYILKADVNFRKLLWVDRKLLTKDMLRHMSKRTPGSVTVDDVIDYQKSFGYIESRDISVNTSNGTILTITLGSPSLKEYVENGEGWVNTIISKAEELFTESASEAVKNDTVNDMLVTVVLGIYNVFVTKIEINGDVVIDRVDIDSALDILSSDAVVLKAIMDEVKKFITDSTVALVGIPKYTCPTCTSEQEGEDVRDEFKEIIPIDVVESFFVLRALRMENLRTRDIS